MVQNEIIIKMLLDASISQIAWSVPCVVFFCIVVCSSLCLVVSLFGQHFLLLCRCCVVAVLLFC